MAIENEFNVDITGNIACFTDPSCCPNKRSYDVITPSAARAILSAIYWKPIFTWVIDSILVVNPITRMQLKVNGIKDKIGGKVHRTQIQMNVLTNVHYVIGCHILVHSPEEVGVRFDPEDKDCVNNLNVLKHCAIFNDRIKLGSQWKPPYLGMNPWIATCKLIEKGDPIPKSKNSGKVHLGIMLWDRDYKNNRSGIFYNPVMVDGYIKVPLIDINAIMPPKRG